MWIFLVNASHHKRGTGRARLRALRTMGGGVRLRPAGAARQPVGGHGAGRHAQDAGHGQGQCSAGQGAGTRQGWSKGGGRYVVSSAVFPPLAPAARRGMRHPMANHHEVH